MSTIVLEHLQHANSSSPDLTVGSDGNIGIGGVASPSADLEIKPTGADATFKITSDGAGNVGNNLAISQGYNSYITASNNLYMGVGGTADDLSIVNGNVGIGTSNPYFPLHVVKTSDGVITRWRRDGGTNNPLLEVELSEADNASYIVQSGSSVGDLGFKRGSEHIAKIKADGLRVIGNTNSATGDNVSVEYTGTSGGHKSGYLYRDKRDQVNAAIYNNLQNDGAGSAAAHMEFHTSHAGTLTKQMDISRYGYVTKPNQPGFSCYKNGSQTEATGDNIIQSWTENFDHGSVLNASTGRFTAPVTGKYLLMLSLMHSGQVSGDLQYRIFINGVYYQGSNDTSDGSSWDQCTVVTIAYMNANDYADPIAYSSQTSTREVAYNNRYCGWHGYLLG